MQYRIHMTTFSAFNGPTGFCLQTPASLIHSLINWVRDSSFSSISSNHFLTQSVRGRELKLGENVNPPSHDTCHVSRVIRHVSHAMCHMSCVTCHNMSCVRCHLSHAMCHISFVRCHNYYLFFGWIDWASRRRVCYKRGLLPRQVNVLTPVWSIF